MRKNEREKPKKNFLTAKLTIFDWGWAENVIYKIKARQHEKSKGVMMLEKIKEVFGINSFDVDEYNKEELELQEKIHEKVKWTRNERGQISSPFRKKKE
ncbi:hypothetical protein LCGC14_2416210 [marine sediment metagenome]|uniref:Uncharacterized protein n=1 Tax=marine sediment metagenome TaxID=412755 RepID=A0A0F9BR20_9ZZZZ